MLRYLFLLFLIPVTAFAANETSLLDQANIKILEDKDFLQDFESSSQSFFYTKGIRLQDFINLDRLDLQCAYINRLKFTKAEEKYKMFSENNKIKTTIQVSSSKFIQQENTLIIENPGRILKNVSKGILSYFFLVGEEKINRIIYKLTLSLKDLDDATFKVDVIIPLR